MKTFKYIYSFAVMLFFLGLQMPNVHAQISSDPETWVLNPSDYQYTMTVVGVASFDCEQSADPEDRIAAFTADAFPGGTETFAGSQYFNTEANGQNMAYLTLYSNADANFVLYYVYDASEDEVIPIPYYGGVGFQDNVTQGSTDEPINFDAHSPPNDLSVFAELTSTTQAGETAAFVNIYSTYSNATDVTLEFVDDYNGIDNALFSIVETSPDNYILTLNQPVSQTSYQVHLQAYYNETPACGISGVFNLEVAYENPAPIGLAEVMYEIEESEPVGTFIGTLEAVDELENDTHTYELFDDADLFPDNQLFIIDGTNLLSNAIFDYDVQNEYLIQVEITDSDGGTATEVVTVNVRPKPVVFDDELPIANLITPNNDGYNDFLELSELAYFADYSLTIYNAIGNELFRVRENYDNSWDGTSSTGAKLPSGTYYYILQDNTDNSNRYTGEIHLYRNNRF